MNSNTEMLAPTNTNKKQNLRHVNCFAINNQSFLKGTIIKQYLLTKLN